MGADNDADLKLFVRRKTAKDLFFLDRGFRPDGSRLGALRPDPVEERDPGTLCSTAVRVIVCLVALLRSLTRCRTIDRVFGYSFRPTPLQYEVGSTASTNLSPYSTRAHTRSVRRNQATRATTRNGSSTARLRRPDNRSASSTVRSAMLKARIITRTLIGLALRQPVRHSRSSTRMVYRTVRHPTLLFRPSAFESFDLWSEGAPSRFEIQRRKKYGGRLLCTVSIRRRLHWRGLPPRLRLPSVPCFTPI